MSKSNPRTLATRAVTQLHLRLLGPVDCRAYAIGPIAVRLGPLTIAVNDRKAALSLASAAMWFEDATDRLGATYAGRGTACDGNVLSLVSWDGPQKISDPKIVPAYRAADKCGTASLTVGSIRISVCDRDSGIQVADALAGAYDEAVHTFDCLLPLPELRHLLERRRAPQPARRPTVLQ